MEQFNKFVSDFMVSATIVLVVLILGATIVGTNYIYYSAQEVRKQAVERGFADFQDNQFVWRINSKNVN